MAQNTDKSTNRQSLEHELYNVRSRIKALREAAENAQPEHGVIFELERAEEKEVQLLEALAALDALGNMRFDIEFFRRSHDRPDGEETVRRNSGQFASEKDARTYGLLNQPAGVDGFHIWQDVALRSTISIRSERHDAKRPER